MGPSKHPRFARLALATTAATYLLILVGGLVRASGAGLGCPDWPTCYGQWIPPVSLAQLPAGYDPATFNAALTWTEYLNRLLGMTVGLLITATLVTALLGHRDRPRILWPAAAAFVLVGFEGWLGGQVVRSGLAPWMISAHLLVALMIVTLLLYAGFESRRAPDPVRSGLAAPRLRLTRITIGVIGLTLLQVYLGTAVRSGLQTLLDAQPELERTAWLAAIPGHDLVHRLTALLVGLAVLALMFQIRTRFGTDRRLVRWSTLATLLVAAQILVGVTLGKMALPPTAQVLHLSIASLLLGALVMVALVAAHPVLEREET